MKNRVVITGLGAVTPIGIGKDEFWKGLLEGKNGIEKITRFDASEYGAQIAGEVKDFDPAAFIDKKEAKRMDRYAQFAVAAAKLAIEDSGIELEKENCDRIGTYIGAGIGGIETMHNQYEKLFAAENADLCEQYGVKQAPTLVLVDGEKFEKIAGAGAIKQYVTAQ